MSTVSITFPAEAPDGPHLRALRDDVDFPYVVIAPGDGYEVVRDEGVVDGPGGAVFVNPFEVAPADDARFLEAWDAAREPLERCHGFLGRRMHRATGDAALRFVNVGRWSSPLMLQRAMRTPDVQQAVEAIEFPSHPALYLPA